MGAVKWLGEHVFDAIAKIFTGVFKQFLDTAKDGWALTDQVLSGLGEPFKTIMRLFLMPFAFAYSFLKPLINSVLSALKPVVDGIKTAVDQVGTTVYAALPQSLKDFIGWIGDLGKALWTGLNDFIKDPIGTLKKGFDGVVTGVTNFVTMVGATLGSAISGVTTTISGALGNLWTNTVSFLSNIANGINAGITAVGSAVGSAVNTIGSWVSEALKGVASAMGTALQGFGDWLWKGFQNIATTIVGFVNENIVPALTGAIRWILDRVTDLVRGVYDGLVSIFQGARAGTPEAAAALGVPMLMLGAGGSFAIGAMGAVAGLKIMGSGVEVEALTEQLKEAMGLGQIAMEVFQPIINAAYGSPVRYYYNSVFRPFIPDTRTADQMLFEENITEAQWRQIYAYHGWKEQDIDAWFKTMFREPSQLILRSMSADPDTSPEWLRKKYREIGFIGEDLEAMIDYGKRQAVRDERLALATADLTDFVDGVIGEAVFRADLIALKFSPAEIDYRVAKAYIFIDRNVRKAAIAAAKVKPPKPKFLSESDLEREFELGLITPEKFISDMQQLDFSADVAERKYRLLITPQPVTVLELERRRRLLETRISRTRRRYDFVIARQDLQTGFLADTIEYLSSLEKPPEIRIATMTAQLMKAADEKALILQERDVELAELEGELKLVQAA